MFINLIFPVCIPISSTGSWDLFCQQIGGRVRSSFLLGQWFCPLSGCYSNDICLLSQLRAELCMYYNHCVVIYHIIMTTNMIQTAQFGESDVSRKSLYTLAICIYSKIEQHMCFLLLLEFKLT